MRVVSQAVFRKVIGRVDELSEEITQILSELVRMPSTTGNELQVAEYIARKMGEWDIEVARVPIISEDRPQIVTTWGPEKHRTLVLNGHMDVVPEGSNWTVDPYGGQVKDGRVYGRGSVDPITILPGSRFS
jgi:acetylornithine deacetylase/succinyl-diaminopimelate desuccinylase-like protein